MPCRHETEATKECALPDRSRQPVRHAYPHNHYFSADQAGRLWRSSHSPLVRPRRARFRAALLAKAIRRAHRDALLHGFQLARGGRAIGRFKQSTQRKATSPGAQFTSVFPRIRSTKLLGGPWHSYPPEPGSTSSTTCRPSWRCNSIRAWLAIEKQHALAAENS